MTENEILQYAISQGIVDLGTLQKEIELAQREKYLNEHKNSIWQGKNGKWYTELPATEERPRRLVKKVHKEDLEEEIINFYKSAEEHITFKQSF